jgi:sRNA-binding protein
MSARWRSAPSARSPRPWGWSVSYTRGVLVRWKMATAYCRAVLWCDHRITLAGTPAEPVDAEAKDLAAKQLTKLAARKAAKKAAETAKPASPPPPESPKLLRNQVRAGLLRRRSA